MVLAQSKATNPSAPLLLNTDDMQLGYLERQMQELAHRKTSSTRCCIDRCLGLIVVGDLS
jgi:hypothetical protein